MNLTRLFYFHFYFSHEIMHINESNPYNGSSDSELLNLWYVRGWFLLSALAGVHNTQNAGLGQKMITF